MELTKEDYVNIKACIKSTQADLDAAGRSFCPCCGKLKQLHPDLTENGQSKHGGIYICPVCLENEEKNDAAKFEDWHLVKHLADHTKKLKMMLAAIGMIKDMENHLLSGGGEKQ